MSCFYGSLCIQGGPKKADTAGHPSSVLGVRFFGPPCRWSVQHNH